MTSPPPAPRGLTRARHRIAHWLGWNGGYVVSGTHAGQVWVGFRCAGCGQVSHYAPSRRIPAGRALLQEHPTDE